MLFCINSDFSIVFAAFLCCYRMSQSNPKYRNRHNFLLQNGKSIKKHTFPYLMRLAFFLDLFVDSEYISNWMVGFRLEVSARSKLTPDVCKWIETHVSHCNIIWFCINFLWHSFPLFRSKRHQSVHSIPIYNCCKKNSNQVVDFGVDAIYHSSDLLTLLLAYCYCTHLCCSIKTKR